MQSTYRRNLERKTERLERVARDALLSAARHSILVSGRVAGAIRGDAVAVTSTSITNLTAAAAAAAVVGLYTTD